MTEPELTEAVKELSRLREAHPAGFHSPQSPDEERAEELEQKIRLYQADGNRWLTAVGALRARRGSMSPNRKLVTTEPIPEVWIETSRLGMFLNRFLGKIKRLWEGSTRIRVVGKPPPPNTWGLDSLEVFQADFER